MRSSTTVAHRIGNIGSANRTVKSVSPTNKGFPHFRLSQFLKTNSHISVTDEASDLKFGKSLEFIKAHHKIQRRGKLGVALG